MFIVTTSWDDGDTLDTRVADTLDCYGIKGTFYVARDHRRHRISDDAIRTIAERHEIGAHTLTHPNLTTISREEKRAEIAGSKKWLETIIGKDVTMFCYPGGKYDRETIDVVHEAGFAGARTTRASTNLHDDPYALGVSLTFFPSPFTLSDTLCTGYRRLVDPLRLPAFLSGESLQMHKALEKRACALFDEAHTRGSIFHLYGHSWANTRYGLWPVFEKILEYIGRHDDCEYLTNGELLTRLTR